MLKSVLTYHVIPMSLPSSMLTMPSYKTLAGPLVYVSMMNGMVYFNQAQVVKANIMATNYSVIHILDAVIMKDYMPNSKPMMKMTSGAGSSWTAATTACGVVVALIASLL
jgi:uncharacterized surface protein with fasciclin (FAS1) repeats